MSKLFRKIFSIPSDKKVMIFCSYFIFGTPLLLILTFFTANFNINSKPITIIFYSLFALLFIYAIKGVFKRKIIFDLIFFAIFFSAFLFSILAYPVNYDIAISNMKGIITACLPFYLVFRVFPLKKDVFKNKTLFILSLTSLIIMIILSSLTYIFKRIQNAYIDEMVLPYNLLFYTIPFTYLIISKDKFIKALSITLTVVSGFLILILGSRGPLLLLILFIILRVCFGLKTRKKIIIFLSIILLVFVILAVFSPFIFEGLNTFFKWIGISGRIIEFKSIWQFFDFVGRSTLNIEVINTMTYAPFTGYGLFGDYFATFTSEPSPIYAHNIIFGFLGSFGIILGPLLLGLFVFLIVKSSLYIRKAKDINFIVADILLQTFVISGFFKLFISSTFSTEKCFYGFLALMFNIVDYYLENKTVIKAENATIQI